MPETRGEVVRYAHRDDAGNAGKLAFVDTGSKVEVHDWKDREAVLAAMQVSAQKWGSLTITGTDTYKAMVVGLAAEHGFAISNPELQDKLRQEQERVAGERNHRAGFSEGRVEQQRELLPADQPTSEQPAPEAAKPLRTEGERVIALETIRAKTEGEAERELRRQRKLPARMRSPLMAAGLITPIERHPKRRRPNVPKLRLKLILPSRYRRTLTNRLRSKGSGRIRQ